MSLENEVEVCLNGVGAVKWPATGNSLPTADGKQAEMLVRTARGQWMPFGAAETPDTRS